jgi:hypothetical protein
MVFWRYCGLLEGTTREEAIARVKQKFAERLNQVEIVPIEVAAPHIDPTIDSVQHPWARFAGMYEANPLFEEVLDSIQSYRRALN